MVDVIDPMLLFGKNSPQNGRNGFSLLMSVWSLTTYMSDKTFSSFLSYVSKQLEEVLTNKTVGCSPIHRVCVELLKKGL